MAKNKIGLQIEGFEELIERLDVNGGNVKDTVEKCLEVAHETITPRLRQDMAKHHRSGRTEKAIVAKPHVKWEGTTASIDIGFDLPEGLASIFLMYGTPRMKKDTKLYNDIYGNKVKKEIAEKQEEIFQKEFSKMIGG